MGTESDARLEAATDVLLVDDVGGKRELDETAGDIDEERKGGGICGCEGGIGRGGGGPGGRGVCRYDANGLREGPVRRP